MIKNLIGNFWDKITSSKNKEDTENDVVEEIQPYVKFSFSMTNEKQEDITSNLDHDDLLLHCSFSVLCDFIENRCGGPENVELIAQKMMATVSDSLGDSENSISLQETHAMSLRKMNELYRWYTTAIDWNNPVPEDPALANLRNSMAMKIENDFSSPEGKEQQIIVVKTELQGTDEEKNILGRLQANHQIKIREFVGICQSRMLDLIRIRPFMWI